MDPYVIHDVSVTDISSLDAQLQPIITKQVTFKVGRQGPFILRYRAADYTAERVTADMNRQAEILRAIPGTTTTAA